MAGESSFKLGARWPVMDDGVAGMILATGRPARTEHTLAPGPLADAHRENLLPQRAPATVWLKTFSVVGAPVVVDGNIWGFMHAAAQPGKPIPPDAEERLERFTELVATAVSNATTRTELLTSRARVVSAADETRRRLERDLHDGIQQWLGLAPRSLSTNRQPCAGAASRP
jgi:GAF domain-containing protein